MKKISFVLLICTALFLGVASGTETAEYPITFAENQTTGYCWFYSVSDETVLTVTDLGYQPGENGGDLFGAGGTHGWTISAAGAGTASIYFYYTWAWAQDMPDPNVTYTFSSDDGETLALVSAEGLPEQYVPGVLAVNLRENPTTGYQWTTEADVQGILTPLSDTYTPNQTGDDLVGAGGVHTWIYEIKAEGTVVLIFRYARSFENGEPAEAEFEIELTYIVDEALNAALMGIGGDYSLYLADVQ